jgi:hypothetical protein
VKVATPEGCLRTFFDEEPSVLRIANLAFTFFVRKDCLINSVAFGQSRHGKIAGQAFSVKFFIRRVFLSPRIRSFIRR